MKIFKKNIKVIFAFILGLIVSVPVVYATGTILFASSQVSFDNTRANLTKTNGDPVETVEEAVEALARNSSGGNQTCSNSPFQLGDYIDMTPTSTTFTTDTTYTGYTSTNTLNPSELSVWRVIEINPDCTVEVVSEYVSSTDVYFKGKEGYQNYIYYLNEIAKQYANTTYTLDPSNANTPDGAFRNVGYDGQTKQITNTTRLDDQTLGASGGAWYNKTTTINGEESLGGGDNLYTTDLNLMAKANVSTVAYKYNTTTPTSYWLASRLFYWYDTSDWLFYARVAIYNGDIRSNNLYNWSSSSFKANGGSYAVRPIITLKSGLTTTSGSGTSASHYTLSAS